MSTITNFSLTANFTKIAASIDREASIADDLFVHFIARFVNITTFGTAIIDTIAHLAVGIFTLFSGAGLIGSIMNWHQSRQVSRFTISGGLQNITQAIKHALCILGAPLIGLSNPSRVSTWFNTPPPTFNFPDQEIQFFPTHEISTKDCWICKELDSHSSSRPFRDQYGQIHEKLENIAQKMFYEMKISASEQASKKHMEIKFSINSIEDELYWALGHMQSIMIEITLAHKLKVKTYHNSDGRIHIYWDSRNEFLVPQKCSIKLQNVNSNETSQKLWEQALKGTNCDVTLETKTGKLKAHKCVLVTSPYFNAALSFRSQPKELTLEAPKKIAQAFLEHLYTGNVANITSRDLYSIDDLIDLFETAKSHEADMFASYCLYYLNERIEIEDQKDIISQINMCVYEEFISLMLYWVEMNPLLISHFKIQLPKCSSLILDQLKDYSVKNKFSKVEKTLDTYVSFIEEI